MWRQRACGLCLCQCIPGKGAGWCRLLNSLSLVAEGLSVGYETWPQISWNHPFVIDWFRYKLAVHCNWGNPNLQLGLPQLQWIVCSCDRWEFQSIFRSCLPWGLCMETVKESMAGEVSGAELWSPHIAHHTGLWGPHHTGWRHTTSAFVMENYTGARLKLLSLSEAHDSNKQRYFTNSSEFSARENTKAAELENVIWTTQMSADDFFLFPAISNTWILSLWTIVVGYAKNALMGCITPKFYHNTSWSLV